MTSDLVQEVARIPVDRLQPAHYVPERVPAAVRRYSGDPDTLGVGRPGKVGLLDLGFERVAGRTELVRRFQKTPLQIMRPLYVDPLRPDLPVVYLMATGGGIVQADRLRMDFGCGDGTSVHLTTQAATKVHRMDTGYATQLVKLDVAPDAYVEYLPDPIIPFGGSRFYQRTVVTADPSATVLASETVAAGRLARGEAHAYDVFAADFEIRRPRCEPVAIDTVRLEPRRTRITGPAVFGHHTIMATLYVVTPLREAALVADALHAAVADWPVCSGVSILPGDSGAWIRLLSDDSPAVRRALRAAWNAVRQLLIGIPAPALRKS